MIYISGIHGIGKTTICSVLSENLGWEHVSASSLLKKHKTHFGAIKTEQTINEDIDTVLYGINQLSLDSPILFDGHFILLDDKYNLIEIKQSFFSSVSIDKIVLLIDNPESIRKRLKERDGLDFSVEFLDVFQKQELEYSQKIANLLDVELMVVNISVPNYMVSLNNYILK